MNWVTCFCGLFLMCLGWGMAWLALVVLGAALFAVGFWAERLPA